MRVLLVALLIHGLAPAVAELGEAAVHYAWTGHAAHSPDPADGCGQRGDPEHGCGVTQHHCACCPGQAIAQPVLDGVARFGGAPRVLLAATAEDPASPEPGRLFRPPIS